MEVDASNRVHRIITDVPAEPGRDIVLSIDSQVQAATESFLRQGLISARKSVRQNRPSESDRATTPSVAASPREGKRRRRRRREPLKTKLMRGEGGGR